MLHLFPDTGRVVLDLRPQRESEFPLLIKAVAKGFYNLFLPPREMNLASPANFAAQKSSGKIGNADHMILGCCHHCKYMPVAKHPNSDHRTMGTLDGYTVNMRISCKSLFFNG